MAKNKDFNYIWTDKKRTIFGLPISFTRYFLTEKKLIVRTGFLNITELETELYKICDKKLTLSLGQRIVNCGSITIFSRDTDTPTFVIKSVKNPRKVSELLEQYADAQRDKYGTRGRDLLNIDDSDND
ncbi:MAG: PH domain-containing protein [Oscillospiraceae bacterium]|nr:PH domain-containing protein [Oscillospiraceae bacterium]